MKKLLGLLFVLICFTIFSCIVIKTPIDTLFLLNWGEYMDRDLIAEFEELYNCQVIEEQVVSTETMVQKIRSKTTPYDVAIPGDYAISELKDDGLLYEIDVNNPEYTYLNQYESMFTDDLKALMDEYIKDSNNQTLETYYMPYFWGAYSIIYHDNYDVEDVVLNNGFKALFDRSLYDETVKIGMYETPRWIVSAYLMSNGYNPNITSYDGSTDGDISLEIQDDVENALKTTLFDEFGNDQLKRDVASGAIDLCYTQLGDFFDALYLMYGEGASTSDIHFNVNVPDITAAFFDSMVIPTTSKHTDLANAFINFFMNPDNAYRNAQSVGYCPTLKGVVERYESATNEEYYYEGDSPETSLTMPQFLEKYPMYLNPLYNSTNVYLLNPKSTDYLMTCETIFTSLA